MDEAEETAGMPSGAGPDYADLRSAPRFALLLRTAKLLGPDGEYICIVRDVSASGVRLRMFHALPPASRFELELSNGDRYALEPVWERDGHAGFRFPEQADVQSFVAEPSPWPRRQVRLRVEVPAVLTVDGLALPAILRDISQKGVGIRLDRHLAMAQKVRIDVQGLPPLTGTVCWRDSPDYGIVLQQCFGVGELAELAPELQREAAARAAAAR